MSRLRSSDILLELIELCQDVMGDIRQQLLYYRASVYKDETASTINLKVDQLRLVTSLMGDEDVTESFNDYDAMAAAGVMNYVPGECSYSKRITRLLQTLGQNLTQINQDVANRNYNKLHPDISKTVHKHRRELLAVCRHGSRQYQLFQRI